MVRYCPSLCLCLCLRSSALCGARVGPPLRAASGITLDDGIQLELRRAAHAHAHCPCHLTHSDRPRTGDTGRMPPQGVFQLPLTDSRALAIT